MATPTLPASIPASDDPSVLADAVIEQQPNAAQPIEAKSIDTPVVTEANQHEELLRGVDDVLKKTADTTLVAKVEETPVAHVDPAAAAAAAAAADQPAAKVDDKPVIDPAVLTDAEKDDDKLEFKDHPRFIALRQEALQSRAAVKAFESQVQPLRESAERLTAISSFVNGNGISENEFVEGLEIMAALKNNPLEAARLLAPHIATLNQFTGDALPKALQDRVADGELSEAAAREIVRAQTQASIAQAQAQRVTQEQQQAQAQRNIAEAGNAVSAWESSVAKSDVDYAKKQPMVIRLIQAEAALRQPRTPAEAVALAQRCYADVNKNFVTQVAKPATKPTPSTMTSSTARTIVLPKPKSLLDGVGQVLAGFRG
ncbi:hypothetical protein UFOVP806_47 [uncultured Caudovirales phage]|uniref:Uncharacterized protein n=1 Tax=uncultured Caudovirales phage TaxID=2100421 RepID=A0A6J5P328_9CAUD|nr:hypothetical protein UFOVP806_47 [uncultured Caudovirales phage]